MKTTYSGATSQIGADQTAQSFNDVDIAQGDEYIYILDSASSEIRKFNKTTETMVSTISISPEVQRIIVVTGRYRLQLIKQYFELSQVYFHVLITKFLILYYC